MPDQTSKPLLLPMTCRVAKATRDSIQRTFSDQGRLGVDRHRAASERLFRLVEEQLAHRGQPLQRIVHAVVGPVAIGPFIVARRVDQRVLEGVEGRAHGGEACVGAFGAAVLDVADVDREPDLRVRVDGADQVAEAGFLRCAVRIAATRAGKLHNGLRPHAGSGPAFGAWYERDRRGA